MEVPRISHEQSIKYSLPEMTPVDQQVVELLPVLREIDGFVAITLFGSSAVPGRSESANDVDIGVITKDGLMDRDARKIEDLIQEVVGKSVCSWNEPSTLNLILGDLQDQDDEIRSFWYRKTIKELNSVPLLTEDLVGHFALKTLTKYCLPFGKCYGTEELINSARKAIEEAISMTENPGEVKRSILNQLSLMYRDDKNKKFNG